MKKKKEKCLGFGLPTTKGTTKNDHIFLNIQNELMKIENILEEVKKRANGDSPNKIYLGEYILFKLSIHLIDFPLMHPKLIDWGQPSLLHIDEFPSEIVLLKFMGDKTSH